MSLKIGSLPSWLPPGINSLDIQSATRTRRKKVTEYTGLGGEIVAYALVDQLTEGRASIYGADHGINPGDGFYSTGLIIEVAENHAANEPDRTEITWIQPPD